MMVDTGGVWILGCVWGSSVPGTVPTSVPVDPRPSLVHPRTIQGPPTPPPTWWVS